MSTGLEWGFAGLLILPISALVIAKLDEDDRMSFLGKLGLFAFFVACMAGVTALVIYG